MTAELVARAHSLGTRFAERAAEYDRNASFPTADIDDLRAEGFLGLMVPRQLGGMSCSFETYLRVATALARGSGSTALLFNMHSSVTGALAGVSDDLARALGATDGFFTMRDEVLRRAAGGALYGVAVSEREVGSRLSALRTTYAEEDGGYRLRGEKSVCSGAGHLERYLVAARAAPADRAEQVSWFLVPAGEGITVQPGWDPLGMRATASHGVRLDVVVAPECLLGAEGLALPLAWAMPHWLVASYAAVYVGLADAALAEAVAYLGARAGARGRAVPASTRSRLARAEAAVEAARLVLEQAGRLVDAAPGDPETNRWVYRAKLLAGDAAMEAAATAAELCGLGALTRGAPLERIFRDARSGAIMPARSDVCADYLGTVAFGLDPTTQMEEPPW